MAPFYLAGNTTSFSNNTKELQTNITRFRVGKMQVQTKFLEGPDINDNRDGNPLGLVLFMSISGPEISLTFIVISMSNELVTYSHLSSLWTQLSMYFPNQCFYQTGHNQSLRGNQSQHLHIKTHHYMLMLFSCKILHIPLNPMAGPYLSCLGLMCISAP